MNEKELSLEQQQIVKKVMPLFEQLVDFLEKATTSKTPLMTSIMLDTETVLLKLWVSHKYTSPFQRIQSLIEQSDRQKQLLLKCSEILEKIDPKVYFELIADIAHSLDEF